jgi:hypothetical protein
MVRLKPDTTEKKMVRLKPDTTEKKMVRLKPDATEVRAEILVEAALHPSTLLGVP